MVDDSRAKLAGLGNPLPVLRNKIRTTRKKVEKLARFLYAKLNSGMQSANPDFLVIGPARTATGWLFKNLSRHPQVFVPSTKEIHFFDRRDERTDEFIFDLNDPVHWRWYWTFFKGAGGRYRGDMTPAYSVLPVERIATIAGNMPDTKIIYTIRDPVDRAWSDLCFGLWYSNGLKADDLLEDVVMNRLMLSWRLAKGDHKTNITNWEQYYSADNFKCIFFEDIRDRPNVLLEEICGFLGIDPEKLPGDGGEKKRVNTVPRVEIPELALTKLCDYYQSQRPWIEQKFGRKLDAWLC